MIADHVRAASCAIADGALPSNVEAGYVVRRMIRRAVIYGRDLGLGANFCADVAGRCWTSWARNTPHAERGRALIADALDREETGFKATLDRGLREYEKAARSVVGATLSGEAAFNLFETFGFPLALTVELAGARGLAVDQERFAALYAEHQAVSRRGMDRKFRGGLAEQTEETSRLHTATHLLHAALRQVLGPVVQQKGSNITAERLRFDFSFPRRLAPDELRQVENIVNQQIALDLPVSSAVMTLNQALAEGALAFFGDKYGDQVKVYRVGDFSKRSAVGHTRLAAAN